MSNTSIFRAAAVIAAAIAFGAPQASAQFNAARFDSSSTWTYASYGLDPAFVGSVGIARSVAIHGQTQIAFEVGSVVARHVDVGDYRARLGFRTPVASWRSIKLTSEGGVIAGGADNSIYRAFAVGFASGWTLGLYRQRWFAGTEISIDKMLATRITHTDWYRRYYDPEVKDGWYSGTGGTARAGVTGGLAIGRAELMLRAGVLRTQEFNETVPPMYASLGVGYRVK